MKVEWSKKHTHQQFFIDFSSHIDIRSKVAYSDTIITTLEPLAFLKGQERPPLCSKLEMSSSEVWRANDSLLGL